MPSSEFTIRDDFPPVGYDQWRALVEADLQGAPFEKKLFTKTYEGIDVQPLYTRKDFPGEGDPNGFPGLPPFARGSRPLESVLTGADLRQEHAHPDLATTNRAILDDLAGGVTSLLLRLDTAARNAMDPDDAAATDLAGGEGIMAYSARDLDAALADVHLNITGVALDAGAAFLPAAALLAAVWQRRGGGQAPFAFNADPLAVLVRDGRLPVAPEAALAMLADLATWTAENCPQVTAVGVDTSPYHHAGATAAQDLAFGLATAVTYLRAMTTAGLDFDTAARQILFRVSLGTHHFLAIAKLRAARRLWWRVVEACGGSEDAGAMRIHARTSDRVLTHRDPYVNILRNTVGVFAAIVGGAEAITSVPFDQVAGLPDEFSRRVARNTLLILQEEAHLHRVIDPAVGSR
jgi:methylmalonyl-CoA mutase